MDGLERFEARIARGHIIKILKIAYPGPASLELLELTLNDRQCPSSISVIKGYVQYLADKGYVDIYEEGRSIGLESDRIMARLAPKGVDLIEGIIPPDPGVKL